MSWQIRADRPGLDATTTGKAYGIGLTRARLWDTAGLLGRSLQTLLLEPRVPG